MHVALSGRPTNVKNRGPLGTRLHVSHRLRRHSEHKNKDGQLLQGPLGKRLSMCLSMAPRLYNMLVSFGNVVARACGI